MMGELEALRIDVWEGHAAEALPGIEEKLAELRSAWDRRQQGAPVPERSDGEDLPSLLLGGLDLARDANLVLKRWQIALNLAEEIEHMRRAIGMGEHEIAKARFNRCVPLVYLGKLNEAQAILERCLEVFRRADDMVSEAMTFAVLAEVRHALGDFHQGGDPARTPIDRGAGRTPPRSLVLARAPSSAASRCS
jgi:hypothetical protein